MKAFKSVLSLIILGLIMPAVWAAEKGGLPALEARVAALEAALDGGVSPVTDLTDKTYCLIGQGTSLFADTGDFAEVTANPFAAKMYFSSTGDVTITDIYGPVKKIFISSRIFPFYELVDETEALGVESGTYNVVANLLTVTVDDRIVPFIMTPDAQTFVGNFFEWSSANEGDVNSWETLRIVGVRAANCDGLITE